MYITELTIDIGMTTDIVVAIISFMSVFLLFSGLFKNFNTKYKIIPPPVPANPFNMPEVTDETDKIILFLLNIFFIFSTP